MKKLLLCISWLALTLPALSQRVTVSPATGNPVIIIEGRNQTEVYTFEEYFGSENAGALKDIARIAHENEPEDSFQWSKKDDDVLGYLKDGRMTNACAIASENVIDDVKAQGVLPEGAEIYQLGTLGTLTNVENAIADELEFSMNWWANGSLDLPQNNTLDPNSYAHTLSVVKFPDGRFYTVDNWTGGVRVKEVFPIDQPDPKDPGAPPIFFSTNPDETDVMNAEYRVQKNSRGYVPPDKKPDPPQKNKERSPTPPTSKKKKTEVLTSADPNDKYGLSGAGEARYITPDLRLDYVIRFENMPTASAPAQEVLVRDTLDTHALDLTTFSLGDIRFGGRKVEVPPGRTSFSTRLPLDGGRLALLIDANLVLETGIVVWRFTTLDPATDDLPLDPLDGFLPPNRVSPEGEGSVSFSVWPGDGLPNNTRVRNEARIIFDLNEPIDTPPWINTFDLQAPTSHITNLGAVQPDSTFDVRWAGQDDGSGVQEYDVYLSVNEGPFLIWQRRTPATAAPFAGRRDSTYAFFSIAYDATGNVEPMKTQADAATQVVVSIEDDPAGGDLPAAFALGQNYPNPFNPTTTIRYAVPQAEHVTLRVYDILGRAVATLVHEERPAGWHDVAFDAGQLPSGMYFYQIIAGSYRATRQMILMK